jgi:hypothetical protein
MSLSFLQQELTAQLSRSANLGLLDVIINAGDLLRATGGIQDMPACCSAMESEVRPRDTILLESTNGYGMTVRYVLPRAL